MKPDSRKGRAAIIRNAHGLADGLDYLHTKLKIRGWDDLVCYHMDLKPENILIFSEKTTEGDWHTWKISDMAM
jgi:serine/threonine protein kinase